MIINTISSKIDAMKENRNRKIRIDVSSIEQDLQDFFINRSEITLAYVFGSLMNKSKEYVHDIDIAVFVIPAELKKLNQATPYGYMAQLSSEFAHRLRCDRIDLVILNAAPPVLLKEVISKGKPIYCASDVERIKFEISALQRHADTSHLRKIKRLYMRKRIAKGFTAYA
jgi:predicted nucleotidyltransferase